MYLLYMNFIQNCDFLLTKLQKNLEYHIKLERLSEYAQRKIQNQYLFITKIILLNSYDRISNDLIYITTTDE